MSNESPIVSVKGVIEQVPLPAGSMQGAIVKARRTEPASKGLPLNDCIDESYALQVPCRVDLPTTMEPGSAIRSTPQADVPRLAI
ncbi:MAG: hypothetical protein M3O73_04120, partial [Actinomycetota bacterium]|nr:hypothetical protein [Actinomycetota bacterium]